MLLSTPKKEKARQGHQVYSSAALANLAQSMHCAECGCDGTVCLNDASDWKMIQRRLPDSYRHSIDGHEADNRNELLTRLKPGGFKGDNQQSITDILMYVSRLKESKDKDGISKSETIGKVESKEDLLKNVTVSLQGLVLKRKDRKNERFPIAVDSSDRRNVHERERKNFKAKQGNLL